MDGVSDDDDDDDPGFFGRFVKQTREVEGFLSSPFPLFPTLRFALFCTLRRSTNRRPFAISPHYQENIL